MSSSSWPPQLKEWVQDCLSRATPSNKNNINAELKQILFRAHKDGSINTTDWTKVELESLNTQTKRTHVISPIARPAAPAIIPPPTLVGHHLGPPVNGDQAGESSGSSKKDKKKKRKNNEIIASSSFPSPYHFASDSEEAKALARRAARFQQPAVESDLQAGPRGLSGWFGEDSEDGYTNGASTVLGQVGRKKMKGKGGLGYSGGEVVEVDPNVIDWDRHTIRGTSVKLEKRYLRLTSEPSPADIRPLHVLQQTLQHLKGKWKDNHNYPYALDQFKSVRQDLTVQRIKNEFTVEVYEIHARIALEAKDLGEYNQCQTMLRQLYELGLKGHPQEFLSYRIIYLLHTRNRSDMAALLAQLTSAEKADAGVHHALQVQAALATANYVRFFRLFNAAPNMSGYIMDHFVERERMMALAIMSKGYLNLPLPYLTTTLSLDSDSDTDLFLDTHDIAIYINVAPPAPQSTSHWRPIRAPPPTPLHERLWDCKKAQAMCTKGIERYRVVDLKGQVD